MRRPAETVAFDLDDEGQIKVTGPWLGPELQVIIGNVADANCDLSMYLVENPDDGSFSWAESSNAESSGIAYVKKGGVVISVTQEKTIVHEIGHGLFGLRHPGDVSSVGSHLQNDANNLMMQGQGLLLNRLKYYQWKKLH